MLTGRRVESNPDDPTVGYSGLPNLLGEVELDASLMEELPHVMLVGSGAERFAREMGFPERNLLTPEAEKIWREVFEGAVPAGYQDRMQYL